MPMPKSAILFRIAAILLLLFAAGHTYGFLTLVPPTPEAAAVRSSMDSVTFVIHGKSFSYGGFYLGLGLFISAFYLFLAILSWRLGSMAKRAAPDTRFLCGLLTLLMIIGFGLAMRFFGGGPAVLSALAAFTFGAATLTTPAAAPSGR